MFSPWGATLDRQHPWPEYPRMLLQRKSYTNLNGVWDYQVTENGADPVEGRWMPIVVPFAPGSVLSEVTEVPNPEQTMWYRKTFVYVPSIHRTMMNFEAVDQSCTVYVNGVEVGSHIGGYEPFSIDISSCIKEQNEVLVKVVDPSDQGDAAYGKQKIAHGGMWYTPTSGIWQTVWLEDLPAAAVEDIKITPDFDKKTVSFQLTGDFKQAAISISCKGQMIHRGVTIDKQYVAQLDSIHPWTPEDPFLYDVFVQTEEDIVKSYFGMRAFGWKKKQKIRRFTLNHQNVFLSGVLDQGYSVDGGYTYPSDEAVRYDILKMKELGFNFLRKHIKVECRRWYYWCDKLGMMVMQDMPSGGKDYDFKKIALLPTLGIRSLKDNNLEKIARSEESQKMYFTECAAMIHTLYNCVSIFAWVPFNEGWGQFDAKKATIFVRSYDQTRLIDSTSGWHDQKCGNFDSRHCYFRNFHVPWKKDNRILLLSEFGGYTYLEKGHSNPVKLYGYKKYTDRLRLDEDINALYRVSVLNNIEKGLSGCVYTQLSDVEDECNGLLTADRRVLKIDARKMKKMNERLQRSMKE